MQTFLYVKEKCVQNAMQFVKTPQLLVELIIIACKKQTENEIWNWVCQEWQDVF